MNIILQTEEGLAHGYCVPEDAREDSIELSKHEVGDLEVCVSCGEPLLEEPDPDDRDESIEDNHDAA